METVPLNDYSITKKDLIEWLNNHPEIPDTADLHLAFNHDLEYQERFVLWFSWGLDPLPAVDGADFVKFSILETDDVVSDVFSLSKNKFMNN